MKLSDNDGADYRAHLFREEGGHVPSTAAFYRDEETLALVVGTLDNPQNREQLRCDTCNRIM